MARLPPSAIGATPYERIMGHAPHVLAPWSALEDAFFHRSVLPRELLEQVRRTLAEVHGCEYCRAKGGPPDPAPADARTALAVDLARRYAADHATIDAEVLAACRGKFSDPELVELVAFMGFMWAGGTFGRIFDITA